MNYLRLTYFLGWFVIFLCFVVLLGWKFDILVLRSILPDAPQTTPLTALILLLLGIALAISGQVVNKPMASPWVWTYHLLSGLAVLAALWTGIQYIFHLPPSIEIIFFPELVREHSHTFPGRPSPRTVLSTIFIGSSVFLAFSPKKATKRIALVLSMIGIILPWIALFGYTTMTSEFYLIPGFPETGMSPISAIAFIMLALGVMNLWPEKGLIGLLSASSSGGMIVKILLPIVTIVPLLLSWIVSYADVAGYMDLPFSLAVNWGLTTLLMAGMLIWGGALIHKRDVEKEKLHDHLLKAETRFRFLLEAAPDAMVIVDRKGNIVLVNEQTQKLFGYTKKELIGQQVEILLPEKYVKTHEQHRATYYQSPKFRMMGEGQELKGKRKDKSEFPVEIALSTIETEAGLLVSAAIRDITDRKQKETEIFELNQNLEKKVEERTAELEKIRANLEQIVEHRTEQLELSNQELEAFSYSVSHDLRAPLRAVTGYSNILLEDYSQHLDEEGNRIANTIIRNVNRMGQLIDDILTFSRISRSELSHYSLNIKTMFQDIYRDLSSLEDNSREIDFCVDDLPLAEGDRGMVMQAITNLVSNALKYTRPKKKTSIHVGYKVENGKNVYFIKDNGVGFDERHKARLFEVFQRLHKENEFEGTGVGLAIVQRVIHKHRGKVWGESVLGEGSTFYFTLS